MLHVCFFFLLLFGAFAAGVYVREIFCLAGSFFFFLSSLLLCRIVSKYYDGSLVFSFFMFLTVLHMPALQQRCHSRLMRTSARRLP